MAWRTSTKKESNRRGVKMRRNAAWSSTARHAATVSPAPAWNACLGFQNERIYTIDPAFQLEMSRPSEAELGTFHPARSGTPPLSAPPRRGTPVWGSGFSIDCLIYKGLDGLNVPCSLSSGNESAIHPCLACAARLAPPLRGTPVWGSRSSGCTPPPRMCLSRT